jgi:hypothetical protein
VRIIYVLVPSFLQESPTHAACGTGTTAQAQQQQKEDRPSE